MTTTAALPSTTVLSMGVPGNVTNAAPAGIVTVGSTVNRLGVPDVNVTVSGDVRSDVLRVTVYVTAAAPAFSKTDVRFAVNASVGISSSFTVTDFVPLTNPDAEAVTITGAFPSATVLFTGEPTNVTDVAPAGIVTELPIVRRLTVPELRLTVSGRLFAVVLRETV